MVLKDGPALVLGDSLRPFGPDGYGPPLVRTRGEVEVLTAPPILAVLAAGYAPRLHPSLTTG